MHKQYYKHHKNNRGFTLIEIIVAMVIGLFLFGGVFQLFSGMNTSSRLNEQVGYLQENGRLAIELLSKEIRSADYWGCAEGLNIRSIIDPAGVGYDEEIHGSPTSATGKGGVSGVDGTGVLPDSITLKGFKADHLIHVDKDNPNSAVLKADSGGGLVPGDVAVVTNCKGGDIFQVVNVTGSIGKKNINHNVGGAVKPGNTGKTYTRGTETKDLPCNNCFSQTYAGQDVSVGKLVSTTFSIITPATGEPYLNMKNTTDCSTGTGCALIEGVENMQILYGEDTNGDNSVDRYVTASAVKTVMDMDKVIAIQISLLIKTQKKVLSDKQTVAYVANTTNSFEFEDKLMRKVYTATVTIRNRMM